MAKLIELKHDPAPRPKMMKMITHTAVLVFWSRRRSNPVPVVATIQPLKIAHRYLPTRVIRTEMTAEPGAKAHVKGKRSIPAVIGDLNLTDMK